VANSHSRMFTEAVIRNYRQFSFFINCWTHTMQQKIHGSEPSTFPGNFYSPKSLLELFWSMPLGSSLRPVFAVTIRTVSHDSLG